MTGPSKARRFEGLPEATVGGLLVPVAVGARARLLGLAGLDRDDAPPGLLIPRCAGVHTFGMRFSLDIHFVGRDGEVLLTRPAVGPRRFASHRRASGVLEVPSTAESGEFAARRGRVRRLP